jgi:predicted transcriptional regulator
MKRTTIFVPEALERDLQLYARRKGKATAAVVREALEAFMAEKCPAAELPSFAAAFDSGFTDTAERHEEILFKGVSPHGPAATPASRPSLPRRRAKRDGGRRQAAKRR